ncbi:WD40 repeat domain-containing serine/threonine protein kinase [Actinoallomurus sp. CA-150999]|uniref:WD40 repeat domain-containing serine/threonine protein kinase n=1 Tax=Actinoallomurus sp. CA-150999 TaxID=3239887 RepID=UPI003D8F5E64
MVHVDSLSPDDPRQIGPYRLDGRLGAGGMGQVYLGTSPGGRKVAVKVIQPELANTPQFRARFAREVEAARRVGGFHTAHVVDADPGAEAPWLVTAFIPGPTLHKVVTQRGPLPPEAAARLGAGLAEGLAAIHQCGLVHRDLKPGNIIMADDGPRIIDFGIARAMDATSLTATGSVIGTYAYMSPEQIHADRTGPASDVFSLGSVLVFAATGRSPFDAPTIAAIVHRILHDPPALDGLGGDLHAVLAACLAKEPTDRPTAQSLPARFTSLRPGGTALPAPTMAVPATTIHPQTWIEPDPQPAPFTRPEPSRGVSRRALIIGGLAATATTAVAGTSVLLYGREHSASRSGRPTAGNTATGSNGVALTGPQAPITAVAFDPTGRTLLAMSASSADNSVWRWNLATRRGAAVHLSTPRSGLGQPTVFSPDRTLLAKADLNKIMLWDVATGRVARTFTVTAQRLNGEPTDGYVFSAAISPDGRTLAAAGLFRGVYVWDTSSGRSLGIHKDSPGGHVAFSPDGRLLLTGDHPVQLRAMPAGRVTATYDYRFGYAPGAVAFSPDSQVLAITVHETIYLWNVVSQRPIITLKGHTGYIQTLAFHPRGGTLASGGDDKTIRLWNTATGATVTTFTTLSSVSALAFTPDGSILAAGLSGGSGDTAGDRIRLWHIP